MPGYSLVVTGFAVHQMIASEDERKLGLKQQRMAELKERTVFKAAAHKGKIESFCLLQHSSMPGLTSSGCSR